MLCRVYLDGAPDGPWMGHVLDQTGCIWLGATREEVLANAPVAIKEFFAWLRKHGEPGVSPPASVAVQVEETQEVPGLGQSGAAVGFFEPDRGPATDDDIATTVRRLGYARRDLLEAVAGLGPEDLDRKPKRNKRTVRQNLIHVRNCHGFYLSRVLGMKGAEAALPMPWPEDTFASLAWVMERSVEALLDLPGSLRSGVFPARKPAEDWTARKMLRRFVEHEREHVEVVRRTIASGWTLTTE
ncbi:MAG: type II toxin-antitoxin system HicB family antitoxin [bacterium]|nr:type II toxin-antitoxin system HicB family antitoxin [bacterium]